VGICKQITILIIHQVISRLVAPLKLIYSSLHVSDVLALAVCCKLSNFVFQIVTLFFLEIPLHITENNASAGRRRRNKTCVIFSDKCYFNEWMMKVEALKCFNLRNNPSYLHREYRVTVLRNDGHTVKELACYESSQ
jgi:hypothetical protein